MHWIDWSIVTAFFVGLVAIALISKQYTRSVADFLVANRCAGRYLLTVADASAGIGTMFMIGNFEKYYKGGMAVAWWGNMLAPIFLILAMTGFVVYRYRETRAMTMGQFFEMRYSRRFRIFAGTLAWASGVVGYGIVPAVTARFFIYFCNLPVHYWQCGPAQINLTLGVVMFVLLSIAVTFTLAGGQITVMITDFVQGQFMNVALLLIFAVLAVKVPWSDIASVLKARPPGQSMVNPFDQVDIADFNYMFYVMLAVLAIYGYMATPVAGGFNGAARTPHEAKMARMLAMWRYAVVYLLVMMMPIVAYVLLHGNLAPPLATDVRAALGTIEVEQVRQQLIVPKTMTYALPVGVIGLFAAVMVAVTISTDTTILHSWGSVLVQDVLLPWSGKTLTPQQHLRWLRSSILGVAAFAWCFSMIFPLREYLFMFAAITGAIFVGGAGAVVIGGLYWKGGTTIGAWSAMIVGAVLAVLGMLVTNVLWPQVLPELQSAYPNIKWLQALPPTFWLNGMHLSVVTAFCAAVSYVGVSLVTGSKPGFDLDRLLHRGRHGDRDEQAGARAAPAGLRTLSIDPESTGVDRFTYWIYIAWTGLNIAWFIVFSAVNLISRRSDDAWLNWWRIYLIVGFTVGVATTIWFLWGGTVDLVALFRALRTAKRDDRDDGVVQRHAPGECGRVVELAASGMTPESDQ